MNLSDKFKDALEVKALVNLKMGLEKISAGTVFDVSKKTPRWMRKEIEYGNNTMVVTKWKEPVQEPEAGQKPKPVLKKNILKKTEQDK